MLAASPELHPALLLSTLEGMSTSHGVILAFRAALGIDLAENSALLRTLSDIATVMEITLATTTGNVNYSAIAGLGPDVSAWLRVSQRQHQISAAVPGAFLDRIARAVEQAELAEQQKTTAA